jgi:hypothetical protein
MHHPQRNSLYDRCCSKEVRSEKCMGRTVLHSVLHSIMHTIVLPATTGDGALKRFPVVGSLFVPLQLNPQRLRNKT